jgi:hypothetical protein
MKLEKELVKVLRNMENEMDKAVLLMEQIENVNDYIAGAYPFGKSFDELALEVGEWIDKVEWNVDMEEERRIKERRKREDEIIETMENIAFGLGLDLVGHTDVTYDMIFAFDLDYNINATKVQIRNAILDWKKETEENYPEILKAYLL